MSSGSIVDSGTIPVSPLSTQPVVVANTSIATGSTPSACILSRACSSPWSLMGPIVGGAERARQGGYRDPVDAATTARRSRCATRLLTAQTAAEPAGGRRGGRGDRRAPAGRPAGTTGRHRGRLRLGRHRAGHRPAAGGPAGSGAAGAPAGAAARRRPRLGACTPAPCLPARAACSSRPGHGSGRDAVATADVGAHARPGGRPHRDAARPRRRVLRPRAGPGAGGHLHLHRCSTTARSSTSVPARPPTTAGDGGGDAGRVISWFRPASA